MPQTESSLTPSRVRQGLRLHVQVPAPDLRLALITTRKSRNGSQVTRQAANPWSESEQAASEALRRGTHAGRSMPRWQSWSQALSLPVWQWQGPQPAGRVQM